MEVPELFSSVYLNLIVTAVTMSWCEPALLGWIFCGKGTSCCTKLSKEDGILLKSRIKLMKRYMKAMLKTKAPRISRIQIRGIHGAFLAILFVFAGLSGCSKPRTANQAPGIGEQNSILQERTAKEAAFKTENSPILRRDRPGFRGLSYFPVDPQFKFSVRLQRYPAPAPVRLGTNTGEIRSGIRYGYFEFKVGDQTCRLQVYRLEDASEGGESMLFVPFRDSTSGRETYGAGRYIDLKENTSGVYDLDFNRAYNPSCAYNSEYSCPVPPAENTLNVPIRAGEKKYH